MNDSELQLQEKVSLVYEELNIEVTKISSKVRGYGWALRGAHHEYISLDYKSPEKVDAASLAWSKANFHIVILKCLLKLFVIHKDTNGYFTDYTKFIKEIDDVIDALIVMEKYENAGILNFWRKKLPNPNSYEINVG